MPSSESFIREREHELSESMRKALAEKDSRQCCINDCLGNCAPNLDYCSFHWKEKLNREEKEREKKYESDRKKQARIAKDPKLQEQQAISDGMQVFWYKEPYCFRCGQFLHTRTIDGDVRLRKIQPKHPTHRCRRFESICKRCLDEGF